MAEQRPGAPAAPAVGRAIRTTPDLAFPEPAVHVADGPRFVRVHDRLRYAQGGSQASIELDGYLNFHHLLSPAVLGLPRVMLEAGINAPANVDGPDGRRRPLIAIRSSPWKAGHESNPWHDEFDLDHGHVRYYGDHKPTTVGFPGATPGNRALLEAARLHSGTNAEERASAPPLLLFRAVTVYRAGRAVVKGHVEFCGVALIERVEHVVQRDPRTGRSFPNIALDLAVIRGDAADGFDLRWIDDRRNAELDSRRAMRRAPEAWRAWVERGRAAIPAVRRRVIASSVRAPVDQQPPPGTELAELLDVVYQFFDGRKHAFELLAARAAADVLRDSGMRYREGWLSRSSGDGGVDFVGRIDVGRAGSSTPLVVLGQAKCINPASSISPDQVARVVARLRRGWVGVFVTTGSFSKQAQIEIIDDQYPVVLVPGGQLALSVQRMAQADHAGDLQALLAACLSQYAVEVTHRRPEEILTG